MTLLTLLNSVDRVCGRCLAGLNEAEFLEPEQSSLIGSASVSVQSPVKEDKDDQQREFLLGKLDDSDEDTLKLDPDLCSPLPTKSKFNTSKSIMDIDVSPLPGNREKSLSKLTGGGILGD